MLQFSRVNNTVKIKGAGKTSGIISVDGDKSISHRAVIFASLARGISRVKGCLLSEDVVSTINCFKAMGVKIRCSGGNVTIAGKGLFGLNKPDGPLDAGNSGTTARLVSGVLAGQNFNAKIRGDSSLTKRPMARIVKPLCSMGAVIKARKAGDKLYLPISITGSRKLKSIKWISKIASAQVKSAVLIAGLYTKNGAVFEEPYKSRDHTERMMKYFGIPVKVKGCKVQMKPVLTYKSRNIEIPGDISSAAYYIALTLMLKNSTLVIKNIGLNDTRTGFLKILMEMGADLKYRVTSIKNNEPAGYVKVKSSNLHGISIGSKQIPSLIDEIPLVAVLAANAKGKTVITGAGELKVKESDRLKNICTQLKSMGAHIAQTDDGLIINGPANLHAADLKGFNDHRIVMSLAVACLSVNGQSSITDCSSVKISCPDFWKNLRKIVKSKIEAK